MPTAARRRADAARSARRTPDPQPPVQAPAPPPPDQGPDDEHGADEADPTTMRLVETDPPFDLATEGRQQHGPFVIVLRDGTETTASWARFTSTSGGVGWGWRTADGRSLTFRAAHAWRPVLA